MLERLRAGEIDVGILALPVAMDGLEAAPLYEEPFVLAVPASHALADRERVKVEDLRGETLLLLEDGHCLRDQALEVCSRVRVERGAGLPGDESRDVAPDGRGRPRHHAAA